jgi:hypothetical protein
LRHLPVQSGPRGHFLSLRLHPKLDIPVAGAIAGHPADLFLQRTLKINHPANLGHQPNQRLRLLRQLHHRRDYNAAGYSQHEGNPWNTPTGDIIGIRVRTPSFALLIGPKERWISRTEGGQSVIIMILHFVKDAAYL